MGRIWMKGFKVTLFTRGLKTQKISYKTFVPIVPQSLFYYNPLYRVEYLS